MSRSLLLSAALAWAALTAFLLLLPGSAFGPEASWLPEWAVPLVESAIHFGLFLVETQLLYRWLAASPRAFHPRWLAFAAASGYGVALEVAQAWVPGRSPEIADALIDAAGAALVFWTARR